MTSEALPPLKRRSFLTPVGELTAVASEEGLCVLEFGPRVDRQLGRLARHGLSTELVGGADKHLDAAMAWLDAYFNGRMGKEPYVKLDLRGTGFELTVWQALRRIGPGYLTSYGHIAEILPDRTSARAIGQAVGSNPVAIIVPCHRVLSANGSLTGYSGGLSAKSWLLRHEGSLLL
ncbi:MAG: methylated-DNA--[protein]-cysteine S-methyltransferase [Deltaproteobacteria bacterium]|nr:MAG: methylated-DNA--[protein]-cysteine S-methyltransferase [Deltaproteobacteria bacterium]